MCYTCASRVRGENEGWGRGRGIRGKAQEEGEIGFRCYGQEFKCGV